MTAMVAGISKAAVEREAAMMEASSNFIWARKLRALRAALDKAEVERDAALAEAEQWRLSHGHLDQLAVDLSVRLITADVWPESMQEGEDGTEAEYIACCANILEAVGMLTAERDRLLALPAVQPDAAEIREAALRATLLDLITEQSEGEWDDKTIAKDVEVFLHRILALIDKPAAKIGDA